MVLTSLVNNPKATLIVLHGCGQAPTGFEQHTELSKTFNEAGYNVVYPKAQFRTWFTAFGHRDKDINFISELLSVYQGPFFATGLSDGAFFANYLACTLGCFNAIAPYAGLIKNKPIPIKSFSVLALSGKEDKLVKHQDVIDLVEWYNSVGCRATLIEDENGHRWNSVYNNDILNFFNQNL